MKVLLVITMLFCLTSVSGMATVQEPVVLAEGKPRIIITDDPSREQEQHPITGKPKRPVYA